jgi:hypothetical protein
MYIITDGPGWATTMMGHQGASRRARTYHEVSTE